MGLVADIRAGLANNLAPIERLQQNAYLLGNPTPPAAEIQPGKVKYDKAAARGLDIWTFTVRVFVAFGTDLGAQKRLDSFMDPSGATSVKAALESDPTLGGSVQDVWVSECSGYMVFMREISGAAGRGSAGGPMIGAEWTVEVLAQGA